MAERPWQPPGYPVQGDGFELVEPNVLRFATEEDRDRAFNQLVSDFGGSSERDSEDCCDCDCFEEFDDEVALWRVRFGGQREYQASYATEEQAIAGVQRLRIDAAMEGFDRLLEGRAKGVLPGIDFSPVAVLSNERTGAEQWFALEPKVRELSGPARRCVVYGVYMPDELVLMLEMRAADGAHARSRMEYWWPLIWASHPELVDVEIKTSVEWIDE